MSGFDEVERQIYIESQMELFSQVFDYTRFESVSRNDKTLQLKFAGAFADAARCVMSIVEFLRIRIENIRSAARIRRIVGNC